MSIQLIRDVNVAPIRTNVNITGVIVTFEADGSCSDPYFIRENLAFYIQPASSNVNICGTNPGTPVPFNRADISIDCRGGSFLERVTRYHVPINTPILQDVLYTLRIDYTSFSLGNIISTGTLCPVNFSFSVPLGLPTPTPSPSPNPTPAPTPAPSPAPCGCNIVIIKQKYKSKKPKCKSKKRKNKC